MRCLRSPASVSLGAWGLSNCERVQATSTGADHSSPWNSCAGISCSGPLGDVIYFMPPYVITEAQTEWALQQIRDVIQLT
ncbi:MAG: hypothetical protein WDO18_14345 [Acidobacteriota bacterium]